MDKPKPTTGQVTGLYVHLDAELNGGQCVTFYRNGLLEPLTCSVGIGAFSAYDEAHSVEVRAGDPVILEPAS